MKNINIFFGAIILVSFVAGENTSFPKKEIPALIAEKNESNASINFEKSLFANSFQEFHSSAPKPNTTFCKYTPNSFTEVQEYWNTSSL